MAGAQRTDRFDLQVVHFSELLMRENGHDVIDVQPHRSWTRKTSAIHVSDESSLPNRNERAKRKSAAKNDDSAQDHPIGNRRADNAPSLAMRNAAA